MKLMQKLQGFFNKNEPIHVFIRFANSSKISLHKKRPKFFSRKNCFENFLQTADFSKLNITCLLDTFYESKEPHFIEQQNQFEVIRFKAGTESSSFLFLLETTMQLKLSPSSIVYFLEDDYLHQNGWVEILKEAFTLPKIDYVTLYDHFDKYTPLYDSLKSKLYVTPSAHWRETPSTTNTYAMRYQTLKEDLTIHQQFSQEGDITQDHAKFCALKEKNRILISSIPGYSTHLEEGLMSPCISWDSVQKIKK